MKLDGGIPLNISQAGPAAAQLESMGYQGGWTAELDHDPFLPLVPAIDHTDQLQLGTGIAVAFARSPMTVANIAWDLQQHSQGRFILGLGTQIRPHITKRFSMPWAAPVAQMREFIGALHAIWDSWESDTPLKFKGEHYRHTLMTPMFNPGPCEHGRPPIFLAAVGPKMTELAGEAADGWFSHGFTTEAYLKEISLPAFLSGVDKSGRERSAVEISIPAMSVMGHTEAELEAAAVGTRQQIAFYGSTPAYRAVLEHHGWGDLQSQLNTLSKAGEWVKMGELITDDILHTFAAVGTPVEVADELWKRFAGAVDRLSFYATAESAHHQEAIARLNELQAAG